LAINNDFATFVGGNHASSIEKGLKKIWILVQRKSKQKSEIKVFKRYAKEKAHP
jgi:hypothetical protein